MKIAGFTYADGKYHLVMKSDSSLLNQNKPFFYPDFSQHIVSNLCLTVRICRLGRSIESRFASRYYDEMAYGIDFRAEDLWQQGLQSPAIAFDCALDVNYWQPADMFLKEQPSITPDLINNMVAEISRYMTIRIGDILFMDVPDTQQIVQTDSLLVYSINNQDVISCKIK